MSEPTSDDVDVQLVETNNINLEDVTDSISMSELGSSGKEEESTVSAESNSINSEAEIIDSISMSELSSKKDLDTKENLPLVYALGELSHDFGTETRLKSFIKAMPGKNPKKGEDLLGYLRDGEENSHPSEGHPVVEKQGNFPDVTRIIWTLEIDTIPVYAIQPSGPFSEIGYQKLLDFLGKKINIEETQADNEKKCAGLKEKLEKPDKRLEEDINKQEIKLAEQEIKLAEMRLELLAEAQTKKDLEQKKKEVAKVQAENEVAQKKLTLAQKELTLAQSQRKKELVPKCVKRRREQLISMPGHIDGEVTLLCGKTVPVIIPELAGMFAYLEKKEQEKADLAERLVQQKQQDLQDIMSASPFGFLMSFAFEHHLPVPDVTHNVTHILLHLQEKNITLGLTPENRALNFVATNAIKQRTIHDILSESESGGMDLDDIKINKHPLGLSRPGSELFEAKIHLVNHHQNTGQIRKIVYRVIVDVADVIPVFVGRMKKVE
jgi:hypothetical protein